MPVALVFEATSLAEKDASHVESLEGATASSTLIFLLVLLAIVMFEETTLPDSSTTTEELQLMSSPIASASAFVLEAKPPKHVAATSAAAIVAAIIFFCASSRFCAASDFLPRAWPARWELLVCAPRMCAPSTALKFLLCSKQYAAAPASATMPSIASRSASPVSASPPPFSLAATGFLTLVVEPLPSLVVSVVSVVSSSELDCCNVTVIVESMLRVTSAACACPTGAATHKQSASKTALTPAQILDVFTVVNITIPFMRFTIAYIIARKAFFFFYNFKIGAHTGGLRVAEGMAAIFCAPCSKDGSHRCCWEKPENQ